MTIELGETLVVGDNNTKKDIKPLKAFCKLSEMKAGETIEGVYQGKFESKKLPGSFFHVLLKSDGEGYAYGDNKLLQEKIDAAKTKAQELGLTEKDVYIKITFNGRVPSKSGRSYYSFSNPTLVKVSKVTDEIPF
jgi:hypothetical protein